MQQTDLEAWILAHLIVRLPHIPGIAVRSQVHDWVWTAQDDLHYIRVKVRVRKKG